MLHLLEIYNHYFNRELTAEEVIDVFAGLRVLPGGKGAASSKSRDTHLHVNDTSQPRVVTIYGGKLTSYRATADKLIQRISRVLPKSSAVANTRTLPIPVID